VAVTIDAGNTSATAKQLLIRGTAAIEILDGVAPEYFEASAKTVGRTGLEEFAAQVRSVFEQQARISITPEWARFDDFGEPPLGLERSARPTIFMHTISRPPLRGCLSGAEPASPRSGSTPALPLA